MTNSCPPPSRPAKGNDCYDAVSYTPYPGNISRARRRVAQLAVDWGHPGVAATRPCWRASCVRTPCSTGAYGTVCSVSRRR
ncbi:hypothetical protein ACFQ51_25985 [Streptomyces kaempferi]